MGVIVNDFISIPAIYLDLCDAHIVANLEPTHTHIRFVCGNRFKLVHLNSYSSAA